MILLQLLCVVAPAFAVGGPQELLGAPTQVSNLSAEQQDIVNFAFTQLSSGSSACKKKVLRVNNFTKQVVAGMLYKFNLVLGSHEDNDASCPAFNPSGESCKMVVWVKPWEDFKEVSWDQVTCTKDDEEPEHLPLDLENEPLLGGIHQVDELSAEHQDIVKFGMAQLTGTLAAGCSKKMVSVENFGTQVVAGTLYHFDVVLRNKGCGAKDGKDERCKLVVYEVPWQGIKEVQWDKSTCDLEHREDEDEDEASTSTPAGKQSKLLRVKLTSSQTRGSVSSLLNKAAAPETVEHAGQLLGAGDHDYLPHGRRILGGDDHDRKPHGSDQVHHALVGGGKPHGPRVPLDTEPVPPPTVVGKKLPSDKESARRLAKMQSLDNFHQFMTTHNKVYKDKEEYKKRYAIFRSNMKKVQFLRDTEQGTGVYGATHLADITEHEFKSKYLGLNLNKDDPDIHWPAADIPDVEVPKEFDWREKNAVTPVKNQGQCGSCWAFSVSGNVEGQYAIKNKKLVSLSEQELVDCDTRDAGCNGGLPENAYKTLLEIGGLESEADYGYDGEDEKCKFNRSRVVARVSGGVEISQNETQMAQWLLKNGPISVGLNANAMQFYMGGVSHPWKFLCSADGIDHGVLIVGFGIHDYPLFHKKLPFWTIKNSWGPGWGEQGYYRLYRGDGTCGINMMTSSAVLADD